MTPDFGMCVGHKSSERSRILCEIDVPISLWKVQLGEMWGIFSMLIDVARLGMGVYHGDYCLVQPSAEIYSNPDTFSFLLDVVHRWHPIAGLNLLTKSIFQHRFDFVCCQLGISLRHCLHSRSCRSSIRFELNSMWIPWIYSNSFSEQIWKLPN